MSALATTDALFFERGALTGEEATALVEETLADADDGELFLEYRQSESLSFDDGCLKSASYNTEQGFGLRAVAGETTGYAHATDLSREALQRAAETARGATRGYGGTAGSLGPYDPTKPGPTLYTNTNPLGEVAFADKVALLQAIDSYARGRDPRVTQVMASLSGSWQAVQILRADGSRVADLRPLVRLNVTVVMTEGNRMERGGQGQGGRLPYANWMAPATWQAQVDEALRQAATNLESVPAPAGEMTVILGPAWPGILLHEAIGHGLEGDFNRKKTSAFAGLIGQQVAAPGVTIVDDGTLPDRRGSITLDDEGTPSQRTVLIENGILKAFMNDRLNARLLGTRPTGNGRRESFAHAPLPRMTNTYMLAGNTAPDEIIAGVDHGLYAVDFGGGQVDITSGKFVFSATEAYLIEKGRVTKPVKGATLIGNGPDVLTRVSQVGNDLTLDPGIGTCGKDGQGVPVGVGQPTLRIDGLTVGGTAG